MTEYDAVEDAGEYPECDRNAAATRDAPNGAANCGETAAKIGYGA